MSQVLDFVPLWTLILGMVCFSTSVVKRLASVLCRPASRPTDLSAQHDHEHDRTGLARGSDLLVFGGLRLRPPLLAFAIIIRLVSFPFCSDAAGVVRGVAFNSVSYVRTPFG